MFGKIIDLSTYFASALFLSIVLYYGLLPYLVHEVKQDPCFELPADVELGIEDDEDQNTNK